MNANRDEFPQGVKSVIAHRAGFRCSRPDCRALTVGPSALHADSISNVGVAAHITAAAEGGPRFDSSISGEERRSSANGIWLCQTHAKAIDDDPAQYSVEVLRSWKRAAEIDAEAILGRPVSAQALDVSVQVTLHRAPDDALIVTGTTNLPNGTRLSVDLSESKGGPLLGQAAASTADGMFVAPGFTNRGRPHAHGWYSVAVFARFDEPWAQSEAVLAIVGHEGEFLAGRFAEPLHPELAESEMVFRATFECVAPPLVAARDAAALDLDQAIEVVKEAVLTVDGSVSSGPVASVIEWFMRVPELRAGDGWSAVELPNGAVVVSYSYWNGANMATASWVVIMGTREVRYWNLYGKCLSWLPDD